MEECKGWQLLTELPHSVGRFHDVCLVTSDQLLLTGEVKGGMLKGGMVKCDCWLLYGNVATCHIANIGGLKRVCA